MWLDIVVVKSCVTFLTMLRFESMCSVVCLYSSWREPCVDCSCYLQCRNLNIVEYVWASLAWGMWLSCSLKLCFRVRIQSASCCWLGVIARVLKSLWRSYVTLRTFLLGMAGTQAVLKLYGGFVWKCSSLLLHTVELAVAAITNEDKS